MNGSDEVLPDGDLAGLRAIEACGTKADEFKLMPDDFKIGILCQLMGDTDIEAGWGINYPVTVKTTDMVMVFRHPVESFGTAAELEFLNFAVFGKNFKVAIYGSKADARKTFADHFIYLISTGMCIYFTKFFQDDLTLPRHPQAWLI